MNHLDPLSEWNTGGTSAFDFNLDSTFPLVNGLSPTTIARQTFSFSAVSSPRHRSPGQRWSPFSRFFNLEGVDTRPKFQLMTNLPYFRLQSVLEQPGVTSLRFLACFPRLTVYFRIRLSADTSFARNPIVTNEHYNHPTDRDTARCPVETTRYSAGTRAYGKYCPGHE